MERIKTDLIETITDIQREIYRRTKKDFVKNTTFIFSAKEKSKVIATARTLSNEITFYMPNMKTLTKREVERVVIHEFFHIIANRIYNKDMKHGKLYKDCIENYGYDRTIGNATIKRENSIPPKYKIICDDCGKILGYTNKRIKCAIYTSKCCNVKIHLEDNI